MTKPCLTSDIFSGESFSHAVDSSEEDEMWKEGDIAYENEAGIPFTFTYKS